MAYNTPTSSDNFQYQEKFQVYINDISWDPKQISSYQGKKSQRSYYGFSLPRQLSFDIPENVIEQTIKNPKITYDVVESFCYNALSRKFGHEVYSCQIWVLW